MVSVSPASPEEGSAEPVASARRWWPWWLAGGMLLALAGVVLAALTVRIPYYEFRPGSVRPTDSLIEVEDVETFPPDHDIAFTTVSLRQSTLASYVWAWFDDDIEVVDDEVVLGDRSPDENRQFNLQLMDTSKQDAIRVALLELGYDVPVTIDGVVVFEVEEGSAADGVVGIGDTIVAIDGQPLQDTDDLTDVMAGKAPGTQVTLDVEPPDRSEVRTVDVVLGADPADPDRGLIGVRLQPRDPQYQYPFPVDIDSGTVGGPSAGLAFSLSVIDLLTPGTLTGGFDVAVTGTIDGAGNVGPVGGATQKTAAVVDEGYDVFIVPSREVDEVAARAGDDLEVIGVDTLREALDALASLGGSGLGTEAG
ncbi:MAG: YlbL family protein [Acidimicrobiales bacterium]